MKYVSVVALLCMAAVASANLGWPPVNNHEAVVYLVPDGAGWAIGAGDETTAVRVFKGGGFEHQCNLPEVQWDFIMDASVAQWSVIDVNYTDLDIYIRKPGRYVFDSIIIFYKSNGDLGVSHNWTPLVSADSVDPEIDLVFQITPCGAIPDPNDWIALVDWNQIDEEITEDQALHDGIEVCLWIGLEVSECNSACEYAATGTHTVQLLEQKDWIDRDTGGWLDGLPDENIPVLDP